MIHVNTVFSPRMYVDTIEIRAPLQSAYPDNKFGLREVRMEFNGIRNFIRSPWGSRLNFSHSRSIRVSLDRMEGTKFEWFSNYRLVIL